jgi:dTMP kinase
MTTTNISKKPKSPVKTSSEWAVDTKQLAKKEIFFSTEDRPGTLIIVEWSDGSGKSTQLLIAKNLLESNWFFCVHSIWNSSPKIHEMQKQLKKKDLNMPAAVFDTVYAADFIERYILEMRGALRAGMVVLCDRYMYTALARGYARGIKMEHLKPFYDNYFPVPDLAFYFRIPVEVAAQRAIGRNPLKHYEAGMDVRYSDNIIESFKKFQTKVIEWYDILAEQNGMHVIDGKAPVYKTTPIFIKEIAKYFKKKYDVSLMGGYHAE